jgi:XTP/dITP diphosphohydrolase
LVALPSAGGMLVACGTCPGHIPEARRGAGGFGYDPVFVPHGGERSMAEMTAAEKHAISHRGRAGRRLAALLGLEAA